MLQRFLFIGVGGSGGKTLRVIREELDHRLRALGWGEFPRAWQFLHIDVPTVQDGLDPDLPSALSDESYVGLAGRDLTYRDLDELIMTMARNNPAVLRSLVGWRPKPDTVGVPIKKGAGQYRAIGRMVASAQLDTIGEKIQSAINLLDARCIGQLRDLSRLMGLDADGSPPDPQVVIVTSMAGGSGSGMFLDVSEALRSVDQSAAESAIGLIFAPDIFNDVADALAPGVQPNTLAAVSELLAAYYNSSTDAPEEIFALLRASGLTPRMTNKHGLARPFLVGASNGQASFERQNDMYRASGKTLAAFVLSEAVQQQMGPYITATWEAGASASMARLGLEPGGREKGVMSAMGFAGLTLGRDRFADYAAERLAKAALERVLRGHYDLARERKPDEQLERETNDGAVEGFLRSCGLWELGPENNDVLDAIRPGGADSAFTEKLRLLEREVRQAVEAVGAAQAPSTWVSDIRTQFRERRGVYEQENQIARLGLAHTWVREIQDQIVEAVQEVISTKGARVAAGLLKKLPGKLDETIAELQQERVSNLAYVEQFENAVRTEIEAFGEALHAGNPAIARSTTAGAKSLAWQAEADLREITCGLLADLRDEFVRHLERTVRAACDRLAQEEKARSDDGEPAQSTTWPDESGELPTKFEAAENEVYIDPPEEFNEVFRAQIQETVKPRGADREPFATAMRKATAEAILHVPERPGAVDERRLVGITQRWVPAAVEYRPGGGAASPAAFVVSLSLDELLERARGWVFRFSDDNAIGVYVRETLREYVNVDAADAASRTRRLANALEAAISVSAPLAAISKSALVATHGQREPEYISIFTEIPFTPRSNVAKELRSVLTRQKIDAQRVNFVEGDQQRIDIFTVMSTPYHPIVFRSLCDPIKAKWDEDVASLDTGEFWNMRRARPLPQFIPVSPAARLAMVRGWYIGRLLGQISTEDDRTTTIYCPHLDQDVRFPEPGLRGTVKRIDRLGTVLESMPLALLQFHNQPDSALPLEPYRRLIAFGHFPELAQSPLGAWILRGELEEGAPTPPFAASEHVDNDEAEVVQHRLDAVVAEVDRLRTTLDKEVLSLEPKANDKFFEIPLIWELRDDIAIALNQLSSDLASLDGIGTEPSGSVFV